MHCMLDDVHVVCMRMYAPQAGTKCTVQTAVRVSVRAQRHTDSRQPPVGTGRSISRCLCRKGLGLHHRKLARARGLEGNPGVAVSVSFVAVPSVGGGGGAPPALPCNTEVGAGMRVCINKTKVSSS